MKAFYFSATGNNLYVAKRISGEEFYSIPKLMKEERFEFEDDKIGLVFPVYHLQVPSIVEKFLAKAKLTSDYIFAVISYGRYTGTVTSQLQEMGKQHGIKFSYINKIAMVDNYLPAFNMDKEIKKEPKRNIEKNLEKIIQDITSRKSFIKKGNLADRIATRVYTKFLAPALERILLDDPLVFDKNFYIDDTCNGCGICSRVCPVDNIELIDKKPAYKGNCMRCMACINNCPQIAIRLKGERSKARFRNQNVSLKEIINANH